MDHCLEENNVLDSAQTDRIHVTSPHQQLVDEILKTPVEYQDSSEFHLPNASDFILTPTPGLDDDMIYGLYEPEFKEVPNGTPVKMRYLYQVDLLTAEQEVHLFRKMNYLKFLAEKLRARILETPHRVDLKDRFETKLRDAGKIRDYLVAANFRLVVSIAKSLGSRPQELDDLIGYGHLPLIRAAEIFNYERGNRFSTYATWAVRNHLLRILKKQAKHDTVITVTEELPVIIDRSQAEMTLPSEARKQKVLLEQLVSQMPKRDQYIVMNRYGLNEKTPPRSFRELGEALGISTERVRQLHNRIIERMHQSFKDEGHI